MDATSENRTAHRPDARREVPLLKHRYTGQLVRPVPFDELPASIQGIVTRTRLRWITRNSRCPCGSGKRFKRCCMTTHKQ